MTEANGVVSASLERLVEAHPLPPGWRVAESFVDSTAVEGLRIHVVGLLARSEDGREVTGSAGALESHPLRRAYFELLERAVVVDAERHPLREYDLFEWDVAVGRVTGEDVVQTASEGATFSYSRSNGVAAGSSWRMACEAARAELIERDRILRSWYGQTCPIRRELVADAAISALEPYYEFEAYTFPESYEPPSRQLPHTYDVVGLFGFPKVADAPLICGLAAAPTGAQALSKASGECLQRWAFLWGEIIPESAPAFACGPEYHQELFLWPKMHDALRIWLRGGHVGAARICGSLGGRRGQPAEGVAHEPVDQSAQSAVAHHLDARFIALRRGVGSEISVAKATPGVELPLVFGSGHPMVEEPLPVSLRVHPIA